VFIDLNSDVVRMMRRISGLFAAFMLTLGSSVSHSQTVQDKAGVLKTWREQCSEADPDLVLSFLQSALETGDTAIIRICLKQAGESDNDDVANLALRAAIASMPRIAFDVEPPAKLAKMIERAGDDDAKQANVERTYEKQIWNSIQTGLIFEITDADIKSGSAKWFAMPEMTKAKDPWSGKVVITGDRLTWQGQANLSPGNCFVKVALTKGFELKGTFQCGKTMPFTIHANLL
jgi:hypothetical protein